MTHLHRAPDLRRHQQPPCSLRVHGSVYGGIDIAMKVPPHHQYEATLAFYRDVIGLKHIEDKATAIDFELGPNRLRIDQYLQAGLVDEMHVAISPILLGSGEHLLANIDTPALGYQCTEHVTTANAMHFILTKRA